MAVEHTFRAQKKDTREWVYGNLVVQPNSTFIIPKTEKDQLPDFVEVIPETVSKFTGRYCQNQPIYENSIIKYIYPLKYYIVIWEEERLRYSVRQNNDTQTFSLSQYSQLQLDKDFKVVGNIFDNPELLKR